MGHPTKYVDVDSINMTLRSKAFNDLLTIAQRAPMGNEIIDQCTYISKMLVEKNIAYGNSALNPIRVFSNASTTEQLLVRIDDKLNRLKNGTEYADEDTVMDLIGYLILYRIARLNADDNEETE